MATDAMTRSDPGADRDRSPVLEIRNLVAGYGDLIAVRDVSMQVFAGEVIALLGPNGAGKTTSLLACVGALGRVRGEVRWMGEPVDEQLHQMSRRGLAFVPEERSVIYRLTVRDNLQLGRGKLVDALRYFPELSGLLGRNAGLLSGGEQQMLTLARALASRPRMLVVDELSLGLAPLMVDRLLTVLREAASESGLAVLLVEQQVRRALAVADRWYLMNNGRIKDSGDCSGDVTNDRLYAVGAAKRAPASADRSAAGPTPPVDEQHDGVQDIT